jgi:hypothetical protein
MLHCLGNDVSYSHLHDRVGKQRLDTLRAAPQQFRHIGTEPVVVRFRRKITVGGIG